MSAAYNHDLHLAYTISSAAEVETLETYESALGQFADAEYTYVPLPLSEQYYDRSDECLHDLDEEQFVEQDTPIVEIVHLFQRYPFVLIDMERYGYEVANGELQTHRQHGGVGDLYAAAEVVTEHPSLRDSVIEHERDRYRIVTWADLNRREVKSMLYMLVGELESTIADRIRVAYTSEELVPELSEDTVDYWQSAREDGIRTHVVERMYLSEMKQVFKKSDELIDQSGYASGSQFQESLSGVVELRHKVMHPARTLVYTRDDVERLVGRIERIESAIDRV